jgi:hypothetical protein
MIRSSQRYASRLQCTISETLNLLELSVTFVANIGWQYALNE